MLSTLSYSRQLWRILVILKKNIVMAIFFQKWDFVKEHSFPLKKIHKMVKILPQREREEIFKNKK